VIIAMLDFFQGLIAIIRGSYFLLTPNQIIVFDLKTWGWITLIWAIILGLVGFGLLGGQGWARWTAIVLGSLNFLVLLSFVGAAQYPLWALTVMILNVIVLYALIVHWNPPRDAAYAGA
jgi:hypothetical protein